MKDRLRRIACFFVGHHWSCPREHLAGTGHFAACWRCWSFMDEHGTITPD